MRVLAFAGPTADALRTTVRQALERLDGGRAAALDESALCTEPAGGETGRHRMALVAPDVVTVMALLRQFLEDGGGAPHEDDRWSADSRGMVVSGVAPSAPAPLCMLMSDVGTDWWGSGQWLMDDAGGLLFGADGTGLAAAAATLIESGLPDPIALLRSDAAAWQGGAASSPQQTHAALFALHIALLSVWDQLGVARRHHLLLDGSVQKGLQPSWVYIMISLSVV